MIGLIVARRDPCSPRVARSRDGIALTSWPQEEEV
jgi:hypothetical protein